MGEEGQGMRNQKHTHCRKGHELTQENTITDKRGNRRCRICRIASRGGYPTLAEAHQAISDGARRTWAVPEISKRRSDGIRRAGGKPGRKLTHCKKGHEFTPENTVTDIHGKRRCRTCRNAGRSANAANKRATDPEWREKERESHRKWAAKKYHADPAAASQKQRAWLHSDPKHIETAHQATKRWREHNLLKLREKERIRAANLRALARIGRRVSKGRTRKDATRARVIELRAEGKTWGQITNQMNTETGKKLNIRTYRGYAEA
jgi:hypothetical protein